LGREFDRPCLGHRHYRAFRRAVNRATSHAGETSNRGEVDDLAAPLLQHLRDHSLPTGERAFHVRLPSLIESLLSHFRDRSKRQNAGAVHQDVDTSELINRSLSQRLAVGNLRDVHLLEDTSGFTCHEAAAFSIATGSYDMSPLCG